MDNPKNDLEIFREWPETEVCRLIALKIREERKATRESQLVFAARAGVPLRTYKRLEKDGSGTLETFIRVLRAFGRTQYLVHLFLKPSLSSQPVGVEASLQRLEATLLQRARDTDEPLSVIAQQLKRGRG